MCPIQWGTPVNRRAPVLPFVQLKFPQYVVLLHGPDQHRVIRLHYLEHENGSRPCMGDECPYCPQSSSEYTYAACLWQRDRKGAWVKAICPLGDPSFPLSQRDMSGRPIQIRRQVQSDPRSKLVWTELPEHVVRALPAVRQTSAFDVRPYLLRRWGMFKDADLVGCEVHVPTQPEGGASNG